MPEIKNTNGLHEGISRALSQACVYSLESQKTLMQIHGKVPLLPHKLVVRKWLTGMTTSCITAGFVFTTYFSIFNNLAIVKFPFAGCVSSFATSFIKLPIGNSMRIMQSGTSNNIFSAGKKLYKNNGFQGLYNGYGLCLIEDTIDFDLRVRLYKYLHKLHNKCMSSNNNKSNNNNESNNESNNLLCIGYGALAGAISTGITIPFDTVRSQMCFTTANNYGYKETPLCICNKIFINKGVKGFYNGISLRMSSNAIKNGLFFLFLNILTNLSK